MEKIKKETKKKAVVKTFKGKKALLLAEGCKLNKVKKDAEKRLKEIKEEIDIAVEGTYTNEVGDKLVVSESDNYTDIDPKDVKMYLKNNKMLKRFSETIKVQLTPLKKLVPESVYDTWRSKLDPTLKFSWK